MMKSLINKLFCRETITYIIFGILTTAVNYLVYYLFYKFTNIDPVIYNIIAWIISVLFAFITNKIFVFESKSFKMQIVIRELITFIAARLLSLGAETASLALTVKALNMNELAAKIIIAVIVIIINYFASKLFIFNKKETPQND